LRRLAFIALMVCAGCVKNSPVTPGSAATSPTDPLPCAEEDRRRIDPCRVGIADLPRVSGHDERIVQVTGGLLVRRDGLLLVMAGDQPEAPFVVLDPAPALAQWPGMDVDDFVDYRVQITGRYTSGDVRAPAVQGAGGTLSAERIGRHALLTPYVGKDDPRYPNGKSPYERACFPWAGAADGICRYEISGVVQMGDYAPRNVQTIGFVRLVDGRPVISECEGWPAAAAWIEGDPAVTAELATMAGQWVEVTGRYESNQRGDRVPPNVMGWLAVETVDGAQKPATLSSYCADLD